MGSRGEAMEQRGGGEPRGGRAAGRHVRILTDRWVDFLAAAVARPAVEPGDEGFELNLLRVLGFSCARHGVPHLHALTGRRKLCSGGHRTQVNAGKWVVHCEL